MRASNDKYYSSRLINPKKKNSHIFLIVLLILSLSIFVSIGLYVISLRIDERTAVTEAAGNNKEKNLKCRDAGVSMEIKEIQNVPVIGQFPELPRGCEVTAISMLLRWAGIDVSKEELARSIKKGAGPILKNGISYGSNPNDVFVGDPFSNSGFGVYHKPAAGLINSYLPGKAEDISGQPFENIIKAVNEGRPVIVWATVNLAQPDISARWYDENGNEVVWTAPEHTFLLIGYSDEYVIVNDPYTGKRREYPIQLFKERWESMGEQAVTVNKSAAGEVIVTRITVPSENNFETP